MTDPSSHHACMHWVGIISWPAAVVIWQPTPAAYRSLFLHVCHLSRFVLLDPTLGCCMEAGRCLEDAWLICTSTVRGPLRRCSLIVHQANAPPPLTSLPTDAVFPLSSQCLVMDEVIFFRRPPESSHLLLFNLPKPPNHIEQDELHTLCEQYGQLYDCTIRYSTAAPAAATTEDDYQPTQNPQQPNSTHQQQPQPPSDHQSADSAPSPAAASSILPHELPVGATVASVYAHVHYFSLHDARTAKKALHNRLIHSSRIRATFSSRSQPAGRHTQLPFHACLSLMNGVMGYGRWSCAVKWLVVYDAALHSQIVAGQSAGSAAVWELEAYERMRGASWPCSFACEVELAVAGEVNVCCQAVSHSVGDGGLRDRENGRKRAVTNAYAYLFQHLALIRTKEGGVHVRSWED